MNIPDTNTILYNQASELLDLIEDTVEHFCQENMCSGQKVYTMLYSLAEAKLDQFPDIDYDD